MSEKPSKPVVVIKIESRDNVERRWQLCSRDLFNGEIKREYHNKLSLQTNITLLTRPSLAFI